MALQDSGPRRFIAVGFLRVVVRRAAARLFAFEEAVGIFVFGSGVVWLYLYHVIPMLRLRSCVDWEAVKRCCTIG